MNEKDDQNIIENHESGRKPRRALKLDKNPIYPRELIDSDIRNMFDPEWARMTLRRIYSEISSKYQIGSDSLQWFKVGVFHDDIVGVEHLLSKIQLDFLKKDHDTKEDMQFVDIKVLGTKPTSGIMKVEGVLKYLGHPRLNFYARIRLPSFSQDMLQYSNSYINETIREIKRDVNYGLTIIELDEHKKLNNKGLHIPLLVDDQLIPANKRDNLPHILTLQYSEDKRVGITKIESYQKEQLYGFLKMHIHKIQKSGAEE